MKTRARVIAVMVLLSGMLFGISSGFADEGSGSDAEHHGSADGSDAEHHGSGDGSDHAAGSADHAAGSADHAAGSAAPTGPDKFDSADSDGDGTPDSKEDNDGDGISDADEKRDSDGDGTPDIEEVTEDEDGEADEEDPSLKLFDADGDGVVEAEEVADNKELDHEIAELGVAHDVVDGEALEAARGEDAELAPSISIEAFQKLVNVARKVVLGKMEIKAARGQAKKMKTFSLIVVGVSGLGILLLLMPLVLKKKYPGQGAVLFKYSALAALTFIVTVNLFGGVLYGLRTVQGHLSGLTNPSVALASGTFDTLHDDAEEYLSMGKELFAPTILQMREHPDKSPPVIILENGTRLVKKAQVFLTIAKMVKSVNWIFGMIPIILTILTLVLFVLAIRPTLMEIIKMPAQVAAGNAASGKDVVKKSGMRVVGELKATLCTIGVLAVLTVLSAIVLGVTVKPAMAAFLEYFAKSVNYLLFVTDSSPGLVFVALFGVVLFLVLNLALIILAMSFFLGKSQKIFQQRFNEGIPLSTHARFFKWGVPAVLLVKLFPMLFAFVVAKILNAVNDYSGVKDAEAVSWGKALLMGPLLLVVFLVAFWAVRGFKGIKFLATYKVKVKTPSGVESTAQSAGSPR